LSVPDEGYSSNVPDEGYSSNVPDEGYSRNASCALNLISTFLLHQLIINNSLLEVIVGGLFQGEFFPINKLPIGHI